MMYFDHMYDHLLLIKFLSALLNIENSTNIDQSAWNDLKQLANETVDRSKMRRLDLAGIGDLVKAANLKNLTNIFKRKFQHFAFDVIFFDKVLKT